jgi:hypothetical protein
MMMMMMMPTTLTMELKTMMKLKITNMTIAVVDDDNNNDDDDYMNDDDERRIRSTAMCMTMTRMMIIAMVMTKMESRRIMTRTAAIEIVEST